MTKFVLTIVLAIGLLPAPPPPAPMLFSAYTTNFTTATGCDLGSTDCLDWEPVTNGSTSWQAVPACCKAAPKNVVSNDFVGIKSAIRAFTADQYAQVTVGSSLSSGFRYIGPAVRLTVSGSTGYFYSCNNGTFYKTAAAVDTPFGSTHTVCADNDVIKLSVTGNTFTLYINGSPDGGTETDSTYASGQPGMWGYPTTGGEVVLFSADDNGGGPTTPNGIFNALLKGCCKGLP